MFGDPVGLSSELSCESEFLPLLPRPPQVFSISGLRLYFPVLELWVVPSVSLPSCSSWFIRTRMWDRPLLLGPPAAISPQVLTPWLPVSAPPTGLDECFFFNSLFVGLPYSSIFCLFWLFFLFKFVVVLLVVQRGTVCLPIPPFWPEVLLIVLFCT